MATGCRKAKGWGGGGAFVLPKEREKKKRKKSPRQICLVREPGSAAAGNSVAPVRCATSIHASQSLAVSIAFSSPFVLDDNDAQGAEKSISHGGGKKKKDLNQKCRLKHAALSELAQYTPRLLSLHRIGTENTLQHNPSSPFPSSSAASSSSVFSPFFMFYFQPGRDRACRTIASFFFLLIHLYGHTLLSPPSLPHFVFGPLLCRYTFM